ncbi:MAG TPA: VWA domain-containing protein, partial [Polyangiaceae bacterium]|nr:VWA domain-containing protein [Polyangiaceae bacterium]
NVFTANVGNLLPGEEVLVEIRYVQKLAADEGALCFRVPSLVAPRYVPAGGPAGDRSGHGTLEPTAEVPDAARISPPRGAAAYGLSLDLLFDLGREVAVESPSHRVLCEAVGGHRVRVTFAGGEVALDRDVVVTARGAPGAAAGLVCHRGEGDAEGYFALTVVPDLFEHAAEGRSPREVVFLVDTSGSMEGASLPEAKAALRLCLRHLREGDRFTILAFASECRAFERRLVPFTQAALGRADAWVEALRANGGTELLAPLVEGLTLAPDGVLVLLTDGQVGNEAQILKAALNARAGARVYSFGIGTNVSDALLKDMARQTEGAVEFIHPGERIDDKVVAQVSRALAPRVTELEVRFEGVEGAELAPAKLPPLVDAVPWTLFGRYTTPGRGKVSIKG